MAIQQVISGLSRLERIWRARKIYREFERTVTSRLTHSTFSVQLTNANSLAAPGGLERFVLDSTRYAREQLKVSSLIAYPDPARETHVAMLVDHQPIESVEYAQLKRFLEQHAGRVHSVQLQHSMNWNLGRLRELLSLAENHIARRLLFIHDYHFVCHQHNLLWNDQQFCGPPESIEAGLCATCVYGPTLRPYRAAWSSLFETVTEMVAPSETAAQIFGKGYPDLKSAIAVIPHLLAESPVDSPMTAAKDQKIAIVFSGATGFNKGIQRFSKLIETHGAKYRWVTVGIENYFSDNPLVEHVRYNFHEKESLTEILSRLKPAVAFLGSVVPETFSYTAHEMLAAGIPILTTPESGNIAATVGRLSAGKVYGSFDEMERELGNVESVKTLLREAKTFSVGLNVAGLRKIYGVFP